MAAPQWSGGKWKTVQEAKAQFGHSITSRRKAAQHTNLHIDKTLTKYNFTYRGLDYGPCCAAYDKRMSEIDMGRQSSGKNARTIMQSVIVYPPVALAGDREKLKDWFTEVGKLAEARFGANFIDMAVHFDEVHTYTDPETKEERTSREHAHMWFVPEVAGKLNGKKFSSREVITGFNDELQEMSIEKFHCPMMDGSKAKGGRKVEDMKGASRAAEIIDQAEKKAQEIRQKAQDEAQEQARAIIAQAQEQAQKARETAEKELQDQIEEVTRTKDRLTGMFEDLKAESGISLDVFTRAKRLKDKLDQPDFIRLDIDTKRARMVSVTANDKLKELGEMQLPTLPTVGKASGKDDGPDY